MIEITNAELSEFVRVSKIIRRNELEVVRNILRRLRPTDVCLHDDDGNPRDPEYHRGYARAIDTIDHEIAERMSAE